MGNKSGQACGDAKKRSVHWLAKETITRFIEREEPAERFRRETLAACGNTVRRGDPSRTMPSWNGLIPGERMTSGSHP